MFISENIGSIAQVDMIAYTQKPDGEYKWTYAMWIITVKDESLMVCELIKILGTAVNPEILQSYNCT